MKTTETKLPEVQIVTPKQPVKVTVDLSNAEVLAMAVIIKVLQPLGQDTRRRIGSWLRDRYGI